MERNTFYTYKITAWDNMAKSWKEDEVFNYKSFIKMAKIYKTNKDFVNIKHYIITHTAIEVNVDETII